MEDHFGLTDLAGERARELCHQLLCGSTKLSDLPELSEDPELAAEVERRLYDCGLSLKQARGWGRWVVTGDPDLVEGTQGHELNSPQLSALSFLLVELEIAPAPSEHSEPRILVSDFASRFGKSQGWTLDYTRRAILGPLERLEYIKVVTPGNSRRQAFIAAGPRMGLLDRRAVMRRLERQIEAA